ncbi:FtsQ-type POTRA domain-containing protein [Stigmatella sp. ncwal1]|uniref:Cell division protein FtsQ n=1 Tax=Stigmatella ashevillensis TaxID=2995309 RepID=A0ABT5D7N8_9BACT|nr:FtsQ-type POTRA domain-containing protein [Stigmatella ashevillena]MDC0709581.1 FtsQ-type POTRA domain-containing protein [Stigmatella ashevillena]
MAFGKSKNRRRQDTAHQKEAVKGAVRAHGPSVGKGLLAAGLTAALVWGGVELRTWALASPRFQLREVSFTGLSHASRAELVRLSGLASGQNLFSLDVALLERTMLQHPWVRSVEVTRHFPTAVSVQVVEHAPSALVVLGDLYVLDEEGEPFKRVTPGDGLDLPLVTGVEREKYMAEPDAVRERMREALAVSRAYAALKPGRHERLSEVRLEETGLSLVTMAGQVVRLGEGETEAKLSRLERVRRELSARGLAAEVIHLDNRARPGWVAVKISSSASERSGGSVQ